MECVKFTYDKNNKAILIVSNNNLSQEHMKEMYDKDFFVVGQLEGENQYEMIKRFRRQIEYDNDVNKDTMFCPDPTYEERLKKITEEVMAQGPLVSKGYSKHSCGDPYCPNKPQVINPDDLISAKVGQKNIIDFENWRPFDALIYRYDSFFLLYNIFHTGIGRSVDRMIREYKGDHISINRTQMHFLEAIIFKNKIPSHLEINCNGMSKGIKTHGNKYLFLGFISLANAVYTHASLDFPEEVVVDLVYHNMFKNTTNGGLDDMDCFSVTNVVYDTGDQVLREIITHGGARWI